jgi:hypothetical protein
MSAQSKHAAGRKGADDPQGCADRSERRALSELRSDLDGVLMAR